MSEMMLCRCLSSSNMVERLGPSPQVFSSNLLLMIGLLSKNGQNYIILSKSLFYVHNSLYTLIKFCKPYHMIQNWSKVLWTIKEWRSVYNLLKFFSSCNQIYMINYCKPIFICDYLILQLTSNKPVQGSWFCDKALSTSKSWRYKTIIVRSGSRREIFTMNMIIVFTGGREGKYNGSFFKTSDLAVPQLILTSQSDFRLTAWRRRSSCRGPGSVRKAQRPGTSWWPLPVLPGSRPSPEQTTAGWVPAQTPW